MIETRQPSEPSSSTWQCQQMAPQPLEGQEEKRKGTSRGREGLQRHLTEASHLPPEGEQGGNYHPCLHLRHS